MAIANNQDVEKIATAQAISIHTVRSHLKTIFAKTDTRRQASLATLLNSLQKLPHAR